MHIQTEKGKKLKDDEDLNFLGKARKYFWYKFKTEDTSWSEATKQFKDKFENQINKHKKTFQNENKSVENITEAITKYSQWTYVMLVCELMYLIKILNFQDFYYDKVLQISQLRSNIQDCWRDFENEKRADAIYLSDFHRRPEMGNAFLVKDGKDSKDKLGLVVNFVG